MPVKRPGRSLAAPDEDHAGDHQKSAGHPAQADRLARKAERADVIEPQRSCDLPRDANGDEGGQADARREIRLRTAIGP